MIVVDGKALERRGRRRPQMGDAGDIIPLQSAMRDITRAFNKGGFTAKSILPVLEATVRLTKGQIETAKVLSAGNVAQRRSDAAKNHARAVAVLGAMKKAADAGDDRIWSNTPTGPDVWAKVKDTVLLPYRWLSEATETTAARNLVDAQIPAIVWKAIKEVPKTLGHAAAAAVEGARDAAKDLLGPALGALLPPRWVFYLLGGAVALGGGAYVYSSFRGRKAAE